MQLSVRLLIALVGIVRAQLEVGAGATDHVVEDVGLVLQERSV